MPGPHVPSYKFVEVSWEDAVSGNTWEGPSDFGKPHPVITRGWLVKEDLEYIVTAGSVSIDENGKEQFNQTLVLPRGWILDGPLEL